MCRIPRSEPLSLDIVKVSDDDASVIITKYAPRPVAFKSVTGRITRRSAVTVALRRVAAVAPTIQGVRAGVDEVLERTLEVVQKR